MCDCILITGGAGYIGSHVNKALSAAGYRTLVLDNLSTGHRALARWGSFIEADLGSTAQLEELFSRHRIGAVIHLAGSAYVGESVADPQKYYANNVLCMVNLLAAMLRHGVDTLIFSSSCATYGIPPGLPITETTPQDPVNPYGRTKLIIEKMLEDYASAYGLRYVNLRYFNAAGADPAGETGEWHLPETHLIPNILHVAQGIQEKVAVFGADYDTPDGSCIRDYIHVSDLAQAHLQALRHLREGGGSDSFNLGNGSGFSVHEIIRFASQVTGKEIPVEIRPRRPGDPPVLTSDPRKAHKVLGWKPQWCDIESVVATAWQWHRKIYGAGKV